ncbi:unnamed protein product [Sympodiomycopsis kandeliae]
MPVWGKYFTVNLHPLDSEHYAVGTIKEGSQNSLNRETVGVKLDTTFWKAAVIGIKASKLFEHYPKTQSLLITLKVGSEKVEAPILKPQKAHLYDELFPNLVLNLPEEPAMCKATIYITPRGGNPPHHPVILKYDIISQGRQIAASEKERYTSLVYPPSILVPDAHGRVELWKRWNFGINLHNSVPRPHPVPQVATSSDPRLARNAGTPTSSTPSRKRKASSEPVLAPSRDKTVGTPTAPLSKKARKRLAEEARSVTSESPRSNSLSILDSAPRATDAVSKLQDANAQIEREIQCLKLYQKNRTLKDELDRLRSQLGLPPGDPLGLEAQMASLGVSGGHLNQALVPSPQDNAIDLTKNDDAHARSSGSPSASLPHSAPSRSMIHPDRIRMQQAQALEDDDVVGAEEDWPQAPPCGTGANSSTVVEGGQSEGSPVTQRAWGRPKTVEASAIVEKGAVDTSPTGTSWDHPMNTHDCTTPPSKLDCERGDMNETDESTEAIQSAVNEQKHQMDIAREEHHMDTTREEHHVDTTREEHHMDTTRDDGGWDHPESGEISEDAIHDAHASPISREAPPPTAESPLMDRHRGGTSDSGLGPGTKTGPSSPEMTLQNRKDQRNQPSHASEVSEPPRDELWSTLSEGKGEPQMMEEGEMDGTSSTARSQIASSDHDIMDEVAVVDFATSPPTRSKSKGDVQAKRNKYLREDVGSWD